MAVSYAEKVGTGEYQPMDGLDCAVPAVRRAVEMEIRPSGTTWGAGHVGRSWASGLPQWGKAGCTNATS